MPKNAAGKRFSSKFRMNRHEAAHTEEHEKQETPEFEAGEQEGMNEGPEGAKDIHEVVAEHGPAHEIHMKHDHKAGKHTVTSHHGSFVHTTEQPSAEEAHEQAKTAAGVEDSMGGMGSY